MGRETWMQKNWRSYMSWQYLVVCLFDFMLAPIFLAWFQWKTGTPYSTWAPITLGGGGLYHLSMGAIVGVTSWAKTKEKIEGPSPTDTDSSTPKIGG